MFVSHCILNQSVMAAGVVKHFPAMVRPVVEFCMRNDIGVVQMPCPETLCAAGGLGRQPHGKQWYEAAGLRRTCRDIAVGQVAYMKRVTAAGHDVLAIVGVEFSPACAVTYLNKGRSLTRESGIYMEELRAEMSNEGLSIPMIGTSQRWQTKMVEDLEALLSPQLLAASS